MQLKTRRGKMKYKAFAAEQQQKKTLSNHMIDKIKMEEAHESSWWTRWAEKKPTHLLEKYQNVILTHKKSQYVVRV